MESIKIKDVLVKDVVFRDKNDDDTDNARIDVIDTMFDFKSRKFGASIKCKREFKFKNTNRFELFAEVLVTVTSKDETITEDTVRKNDIVITSAYGVLSLLISNITQNTIFGTLITPDVFIESTKE